MRGGYADPSLIIGMELAFNRLAAERGQWIALARITTKDAILFKPGPVFADRWLKGQRDPVNPMRWQTQEVFMACDGSAAISTGLWTRSGDAGTQGRFTNVWRREKNGYRLVLSLDGTRTSLADSVHAGLKKDDDELEAISARVAKCERRGRRTDEVSRSDELLPASKTVPLDPRQPLPTNRDDRSDDGSLRWRWSVEPGGRSLLKAWIKEEDGEAPIAIGRAGSGE